MADQYISYPLVADARDLMQRCFDYMALKFPGWEPSEGQLDTAILEVVSSEAADIATLTTEVPKSIFRYFGAKLMGVVPQDAVAATATSTWYMVDNLGYVIPDGTQVSIVDDSGNSIPFITIGDIQVPAGNTQTSTGEVLLEAVVAGADGSGVGTIGGQPTLLDIYPYVDHIIQETVSAGGVDAELDDDYLNRLAVELQLITPRPILPNDFSVLARKVTGVQRATTIDGYNTADTTYNNQRMVTVVALDANGAGVNSDTKTAMQTYLDGLREINFVVNVTDPNTSSANSVDVTTNVLMTKGFDSTDVQYRVQQAILDYLNPATWGVRPTDDVADPSTWDNTTVVKYLSLAAAISQVRGVAYIISLTLGLNGGAQSAADKNLTGVAPLPHAGTVTVTVSLS